MKQSYSETYKLSRTFKAPLDFVYDWCTDFQEDDLKMIGSKNIRHLHEKTKQRVIWTIEGKALEGKVNPVRVVWLRPPNAWHLESMGDGFEVGDYTLKSVGKNKTRLDMVFTATAPKKSGLQSQKEYLDEAHEHWDNYGPALEKDYAKSLRKG